MTPIRPLPPYFAARMGYRAASLSWAGLLGLALALAAAIVVSANLFLVQPRNQAKQSEVAQLSDQLSKARSKPAPSPVIDPEQALLSDLHGAESIAGFVEFIHDEAARHSLVVDSADYRAETLMGGKVTRYRVSLPVHGNYLQLRTWIDQVLAQKAAASLDELALKRTSDGAGMLNGRVQLSYFTRAVQSDTR